MNRFLILLAGVLFSTQVFALDVGEVNAAKQAFDRSKGKDGEAGRVAYVTKLAQMFEKSLTAYQQSGGKKDDAALGMIDAEWIHHPMPAASDGKLLSKLILGDWNSPRRTYRFKANGSYGTVEDGKFVLQGEWHIQGNQLIEDNGPSTIVLISNKYLIFTSKGDAFFHSRAR